MKIEISKRSQRMSIEVADGKAIFIINDIGEFADRGLTEPKEVMFILDEKEAEIISKLLSTLK
jgi:hypothetical protein